MKENLEMPINKGLQPPVDKVQGTVGRFVKAEIAILGVSNPGGESNDDC